MVHANLLNRLEGGRRNIPANQERHRPTGSDNAGLFRARTSSHRLLAFLLQAAWNAPLALPRAVEGDSALRFLRQATRPSAVKPVANRGKEDGIGVAAAIDPSLEMNKLPKPS